MSSNLWADKAKNTRSTLFIWSLKIFKISWKCRHKKLTEFFFPQNWMLEIVTNGDPHSDCIMLHAVKINICMYMQCKNYKENKVKFNYNTCAQVYKYGLVHFKAIQTAQVPVLIYNFLQHSCLCWIIYLNASPKGIEAV